MKSQSEKHELDCIYDPETFEETVFCLKCGAMGSELLTWCPGEELSGEAKDACHDGNVVDLEKFRTEVKGKPHAPIFGDDEAEGWE